MLDMLLHPAIQHLDNTRRLVVILASMAHQELLALILVPLLPAILEPQRATLAPTLARQQRVIPEPLVVHLAMARLAILLVQARKARRARRARMERRRKAKRVRRVRRARRQRVKLPAILAQQVILQQVILVPLHLVATHLRLATQLQVVQPVILTQ